MSKQAIQKMITESLANFLRSLKDKKDSEYTPSITLLQYLDCFIKMRHQSSE